MHLHIFYSQNQTHEFLHKEFSGNASFHKISDSPPDLPQTDWVLFEGSENNKFISSFKEQGETRPLLAFRILESEVDVKWYSPVRHEFVPFSFEVLKMFAQDKPQKSVERDRKKILVVDDEPDLVELLSAYLHENGFQISTSTTGTEALKSSVQEDIGIIILDVFMPDLLGPEVELLLTRQFAANMPKVLYISGYATSEQMTQIAFGSPAIPKPFHFKDLLARVKNLQN